MAPAKNGFRLPMETAKMNRDKFYTTIDRYNGVKTDMRATLPRKVLDYSCGDPFFNIRKENK